MESGKNVIAALKNINNSFLNSILNIEGSLKFKLDVDDRGKVYEKVNFEVEKGLAC